MDKRFDSPAQSSPRRVNTWLLRFATGAALAGALLLPSLAMAQQPPQLPPGKTKVRVMINTKQVAIDAENELEDDAEETKAQVTPAKADKADKAEKEKAEKEAKEKAEKEALAAKEEKDSKVQRGVVTIERAGTVLGVGTVLGNDGRILTALSPIGTGNDLDVKYADGTTAKVKVGHHDRTWDLALLVPQSGKWKEGLLASTKSAIREDAKEIRSFSLNKSNKLGFSPVVLKSLRSLLGADDKQIDNVIELGSRVVPTDLGSPILDEDGKVLGMLARGCAPAEAGKPCTPVAFGVPMTAIKSFLKNVPASAALPSPWLGIQGIADTSSIAKGVRVLSVHSGSPADVSKLKGDKANGDVILAVNGTPVTTPDSLADLIKEQAIGDKVQLLMLSAGKYKTVNVSLKAAPDASATKNVAELPAAESDTDQKIWSGRR